MMNDTNGLLGIMKDKENGKNTKKIIEAFKEYLGFEDKKIKSLDALRKAIQERYKYKVSEEIEQFASSIQELRDELLNGKKVGRFFETLNSKLKSYELKNIGKEAKYLHFKKLKNVFKGIDTEFISLT